MRKNIIYILLITLAFLLSHGTVKAMEKEDSEKGKTVTVKPTTVEETEKSDSEKDKAVPAALSKVDNDSAEGKTIKILSKGAVCTAASAVGKFIFEHYLIGKVSIIAPEYIKDPFLMGIFQKTVQPFLSDWGGMLGSSISAGGALFVMDYVWPEVKILSKDAWPKIKHDCLGAYVRTAKTLWEADEKESSLRDRIFTTGTAVTLLGLQYGTCQHAFKALLTSELSELNLRDWQFILSSTLAFGLVSGSYQRTFYSIYSTYYLKEENPSLSSIRDKVFTGLTGLAAVGLIGYPLYNHFQK